MTFRYCLIRLFEQQEPNMHFIHIGDSSQKATAHGKRKIRQNELYTIYTSIKVCRYTVMRTAYSIPFDEDRPIEAQ